MRVASPPSATQMDFSMTHAGPGHRYHLAATRQPQSVLRRQKVRRGSRFVGVDSIARRRSYRRRRSPGEEIPTGPVQRRRPSWCRCGRRGHTDGVGPLQRSGTAETNDDARVENDDDDERNDTVRDEFEVLEDVHHEIVVVGGVARQGRSVLVQTHRPEDMDVVDGDDDCEYCRR